jgi:hypothetical protein
MTYGQGSKGDAHLVNGNFELKVDILLTESWIRKVGSDQTSIYLPESAAIPENPLSDQCTAQVLDWINGCKENHPRCQNHGLPTLPTRVLDVCSGREPFLLETLGGKAEYVTLSYC